MTLKIGFIGAGKMAQALASAFASAANSVSTVSDVETVFFDIDRATAESFERQIGNSRCCNSNQQVVEIADVVFLAVKPQYFADVAKALPTVESSKVIVSLLPGVRLGQLESSLGTRNLIRVMPNTPCLIGKGATALAAGSGVSEESVDQVVELMRNTGECIVVPEDWLDAVTGLSGSGPAFVYTFIESLIDAGVQTGLPRNIAKTLAVQTVLGGVEMIRASGEHPAVLRDQVTSPGGTTIAGMNALEATGFRNSIISAVVRACQRSRELGAEGDTV